MPSSNKSEANLIIEIKELEKKLTFMEVICDEKFDPNEMDLVKLQIELEKSRGTARIIEKKHELLFSHQPYLGIVYFNEERTIIDCNKKFAEIVGYTHEEIIGLNIINIFENEDILLSISKSLEKSSATFEGEYVVSSRERKLLLKGHFTTSPTEKNGRKISVGVFEDITAAKKEELELRFLANSFQNINECIVIVDSKNVINYINNAFTKIYGYSKDEILGKELKVLGSQNNPEKVNDAVYKSNKNSNSWQGTLLNIKKDGDEFPVFSFCNSSERFE